MSNEEKYSLNCTLHELCYIHAKLGDGLTANLLRKKINETIIETDRKNGVDLTTGEVTIQEGGDHEIK